MRRRNPRLAASVGLLLSVGTLCTLSTPAQAGPVAGCRVFPADNWWHADVSALPVHERSAQWLSHMSTDRDLHPDFGPSYGDGPDYGIPVTVVRSTHRKVRVRFRYAGESDRVRYPLGKDTKIEGGRSSGGDMHAIVVDRDRCTLYETWATRFRDGRWRGRVDHAIRFTTDITSDHHLWPARHHAGATSSWAYPPMGARFRLSASFPTAGYSTHARTLIAAMKKYGLVLADNGSPWYFQGERNRNWPDALVAELKTIPASAFVAVDTSSLRVSADSAVVK